MLEIEISPIDGGAVSDNASESVKAYINAVGGVARRERKAGMALLSRLLEKAGVSRFELATEPEGKPFLPDLPYFFSLSHSGGYCAAVLSDTSVGVDLQSMEEVGRIKDPVAFAERFFEACELEEFLKCPTAEELCRIWTRKEALSKLLGRPLCRSLSTLSSVEYPCVDFNTQSLDLGGRFYLTVAKKQ